MTTPPGSRPTTPWTAPWIAVLASLIPWAAFLLALALGDVGVDSGWISSDGLGTAAPAALGFVALPAALPLVAARTGLLRLGALVVMTAVAVVAGVLVVTTDDAQAGLAVLWVPMAAIPLAVVLWIGHAVASNRAAVRERSEAGTPAPPAPAPAGLSDRLAALGIDIAIAGAALVGPLTVLSHAGQEIAAVVVGVVAATVFLAVLTAVRGQTIGQALVGLTVIDDRTSGRMTLSRALLRSLVVVLEVAGTPTFILAPAAIAELATAAASGRSLTDRLFGTSVVTTT